MTYYPSLVKFPEEWNIKKNTVQNPSLYPKYTYGKEFEDTYDYHTLFADVFRNGNDLIFISPPFLNFKKILIDDLKLVDDFDKEYELRFASFDRCEVMVSSIPIEINRIYLKRKDGNKFEVPFKERHTKFDDKKVLCAMIKNEPIDKILNWIEYHHKIYDVNGFIIFNNQSDLYDSDFLYKKLIEKSNITEIEVVDWDIPFGVLGPPWDSDWCQYILLNLCKLNFCLNSEIMINQDIDEYFVSEYSLDEIVESMKHQGVGAIVYESKNISCYTDGDKTILNSRYYYHPEEIDTQKMTKWMSIPSKTIQSIYTLHNVFGQFTETTDDFYYAHMWTLSSANHDQENHCSPKEYRKKIKDEGYKIDFKLKTNFEKCSIMKI